MENRRVQGYEYDYRFSVGKNKDIQIPEELMSYLNVQQFEIRTNFILKLKGVDGEHDYDDVMCSENFRAHLWHVLSKESELEVQLIDRLREYWMLDHEVKELIRKALDYAERSGTNADPMVVEVDVRTVQQDGEGVDAALDRAIRVENLVPLSFFNLLHAEGSITGTVCLSKQDYLIRHMPRTRVEDAREGLSLMEACPICLRETTVGAQISVLGSCKHAFHYHCIVIWLMRNNECPLCRCRVRKNTTCPGCPAEA